MSLRYRSIVFTLLLGALSALPPLGIDMSLPALPEIALKLQISTFAAGATLSIFLIGYAMGPVLFGPMSDRFGRRPILLGGVAIFAGAGLLCAAAPSIEWVLIGRLLQGMGAGIGAALPLAIVRDLFEGTAARTRLSHITLVFSLGPLLAPAIGSAVMPFGGWRGIYFVTGLIGAALLIAAASGVAESLPRERRRSMDPRALLISCRHVLGHNDTIVFSLINALSYACMFALISGSPLVLITGQGLGTAAFSAVFACAVSGIICGAFAGGRLAKQGVPSSRVLLTGLLLGAGSTTALFVLSLAGRDTVLVMLPLFLLSNAAYGLTGPTAVHEALAPTQTIAGLASALLRCIQIVAGAIASALVPLLYAPHSSVAMTAVMAACSSAALLIYMVFRLGRAHVTVDAEHSYPPSRPVEANP